jgi:hypothetical protein
MRSPVVRDRFFATLIGPAGGTAVKSGVDRLDLDLIHQGSAPALRVAASLKDRVPHLLVRVTAEEEGQPVERVLYEGPFSQAPSAFRKLVMRESEEPAACRLLSPATRVQGQARDAVNPVPGPSLQHAPGKPPEQQTLHLAVERYSSAIEEGHRQPPFWIDQGIAHGIGWTVYEAA